MDLTTNYLGLRLAHPIVPGASPLAHDLGMVRRLEDAGAAAIVMHSLFEEQITRDELGMMQHMLLHDDSHAEALSYFPAADEFPFGPDKYLEQLHAIKHAVRVPVIASLNGTTPEGWVSLIFFWALGLTVFYQFFTRYVLNDSAAWTEEIARYLLIATVFIGAVVGVAKNNHIQVDFFFRFMPKGMAKGVSLLVDVLRIGFLGCASWMTWALMEKMGSYQMTVVNLPMNLVYGVVMLAFLLMTWRALWLMA